MGDLEFLFVLLFAALLLVRVADTVHIPYPIVLVLGGLGLAFVPGVPTVRMDSHAVLLVFAPPLLLSAGWWSSPRELAAESRSLLGLAFTLVLVTTVAVAAAAHELVHGMSWALAFTLGGVVAPTDAVAANATFKRIQVPERVKLLVSGESLINDATGLTVFSIALAAVGASFHPGEAALDFVRATVGGVACGVAVGWVILHAIRKSDVEISIVLTVLSAYASYIAAEEIGASGILASAVCGVYAGWRQSEFFDADTRLNAVAFWDTLSFGLETLLFVLLGLQLKRLPHTLGHLALVGLAISTVVVLVRLLFVYLPPSGGLSRRERLVVGWCGMRGALSFAAALSIPLLKDPRSDVLVLTFIVILVTLVGQGLTLPALIKTLKLEEITWSPEEAIVRLETAQAALDRLDELESEGRVDEEPLRRMRDLYRARFRQCMAVIGGDTPTEAVQEEREERMRYRDLGRELIKTERATLLDLRKDGRARQQTLRAVERDLDLTEARLR